MRKLKLEMDALRVESFETGAEPVRPAGTVHGHATKRNDITCGATCNNDPICIVTDDPTCLEPCGTTLCGGETTICPIDTLEVC